jgi:hypothetical protein
MRKIHVVCPICSKSRRLPISKGIFDIDEGALLKFPIKKGVICEHEFLILVDYNFSIRDYEVPNKRNDLSEYFEGKKKGFDVCEFSYF